MSDIGPPRKEPPPSELRIAASPRPVTRLSRLTLVVASALATAFIFAALWYALGIRPLHLIGGPELYNTNAQPTDALTNMRGNYADLTRPKAPPQPVPQLGPPLPGDLGRPMLQQTGAPLAADPDAERRRREREQAAASVVFFTVSAKPKARLDPPRIVQSKMAHPCRRTKPDRRHPPVMILQSRTASRRSWPLSMHALTRRSTRRSACNGPAALTSSWRVP